MSYESRSFAPKISFHVASKNAYSTFLLPVKIVRTQFRQRLLQQIAYR